MQRVDKCYKKKRIWKFLTMYFVQQDLSTQYPIPAATATPRPSQKPSHGDISRTKRGIIAPLVSKRPEEEKKKN